MKTLLHNSFCKVNFVYKREDWEPYRYLLNEYLLSYDPDLDHSVVHDTKYDYKILSLHINLNDLIISNMRIYTIGYELSLHKKWFVNNLNWEEINENFITHTIM